MPEKSRNYFFTTLQECPTYDPHSMRYLMLWWDQVAGLRRCLGMVAFNSPKTCSAAKKHTGGAYHVQAVTMRELKDKVAAIRLGGDTQHREFGFENLLVGNARIAYEAQMSMAAEASPIVTGSPSMGEASDTGAVGTEPGMAVVAASQEDSRLGSVVEQGGIPPEATEDERLRGDDWGEVTPVAAEDARSKTGRTELSLSQAMTALRLGADRLDCLSISSLSSTDLELKLLASTRLVAPTMTMETRVYHGDGNEIMRSIKEEFDNVFYVREPGEYWENYRHQRCTVFLNPRRWDDYLLDFNSLMAIMRGTQPTIETGGGCRTSFTSEVMILVFDGSCDVNGHRFPDLTLDQCLTFANLIDPKNVRHFERKLHPERVSCCRLFMPQLPLM
jgi:hypothetical protein